MNSGNLNQRLADGATGTALPDPHTVIIADVEHVRYYEVEMAPTALSKLADYLTQLGYAKGSPGVKMPSDPIIQKDWADGADTRVAFGAFEGYTPSDNPQIGLLMGTNGQTQAAICTGTLIGAPTGHHYIVTAAHCFWNVD